MSAGSSVAAREEANCAEAVLEIVGQVNITFSA
jgi:hypothetical protein